MKIRLCLIAIAAGLFAAPPARADIVVGVVGPMTGENAFLGEQMKHGAEQAAADINMNGGIGGEKLTLRFADDACDPKQAVTVANQMASAGVKFVVGHGCSGASIPASKIYNEEGIFMITPMSTNPALTDAGFKDVFRVCGRDDQQGGVIGHYILDHYRDKKIAIVNNQSAWGQGIANEIKKSLNNANVKETLFESFSGGQRDFSALISQFKQAGVQVAFIGGYYTEVGLLVRQMKQQGANFQIIGGDALVTNEFWSITGPDGDGVLMSFNPDPNKRPEARTVLESFKKANIPTEGYTLYSYAGVQIVAEAIKRAGGPDPAKAAAEIRKSPVKTVLGAISYDAKGDVEGTNYVIYRWHDGKYEEVGK
jgi:branched-chain amino acid transport system substrate-binding protein